MFLSVWGGVFLSSILSLRYRMKFLYWGFVALLVYVAAFVAPENSRDAVAYLDYYRSIMSGEAVDVELSFRLVSYLACFLFSSGIGVFFIYAFLSVPIRLSLFGSCRLIRFYLYWLTRHMFFYCMIIRKFAQGWQRVSFFWLFIFMYVVLVIRCYLRSA